MPEPRRGTVTFLFTDIEGSTRLARALRERWPEVRSEHRRLVRAAFAAHGGEEVDTQGDSFFYVFSRARDGALASADAQRALAEHQWPQDGEVRIRIGMHTGEPIVSDEGYHGIGVHRAARIMSAGHGGQVLMSEATAAVLADEEVVGIGARDLGRHRLKDLERSEHVFQLAADGLEQQFPRIRTAGAQRPIHRRLLLLAPVAALVAAAAVAAFLLTRDDSAPPVVPNSVVEIDPDSDDIRDVVPVGDAPGAIATSGDQLWVANRGDGTLTHIDTSTDDRRTLGGFPFPTSLAADGVRIWVGNNERGVIVAIDSETGREVDRIPVPGNGASYLALGGASIWVSEEELAIIRVVKVTGRVTDRWLDSAHDVAYGYGAAWFVRTGPGELLRVDANDESRQVIRVGSLPGGIAVGLGAVWVASERDGVVRRVNPTTGNVESIIPVGRRPLGVAVGGDAVWVANAGDGTVSRIDPERSRVVETIRIGYYPVAVEVGAGGVWVAVQQPQQ